MLAAYPAGDKPCKRIGHSRAFLRAIHCRSALDLRLYRAELLLGDNRLVRVFGNVARKLAVVFKLAFGEVILAVKPLEQKIPGVVIVTQDSRYTALAPSVPFLRKMPSAFRQLTILSIP